MRIISGTARGRKLKEPQGMDTRPTTDKVKESLFNIIQFELEGRRVLDLFAGTGQLGLEALSRGAEHCTFVDRRREAASLAASYCRMRKLEEGTSFIYSRIGDYLAACPETRLFTARNRADGSLAACAVGDFTALGAAFYMFAFRRPDAPPVDRRKTAHRCDRNATPLGLLHNGGG